MSTANLIIQKTEDGINFKSLHITIPQEDNNYNVKYSEWKQGINESKKRLFEKSSRLVVKIVSGEEFKNIDIEACAARTDETQGIQDIKLLAVSTANVNSAKTDNLLENSTSCSYFGQRTDPFQLQPNNDLYNTNSQSVNPLEHSLQKVNENNARIMENINKLNRTLCYTKKKEILDIICPKPIRTYHCKACGKCFVYETGLRRHYSMRHAIAESQPRWQVVWTCIQCFQVWPKQDQALKHSNECCKTFSDNQELVREIKTSSLLQCEFCEKVYTSIPRLLRHSKIHTTSKNYECNSCELSFMCYKMAEQHWLLCPWLNRYYSFSLPKMLLCNACDRKFRNYEQLYNHRYKLGHFMTKTHISIGSVTSLEMLVYQCELCSQWYNSITQMITHRSQHHSYQEFGNNSNSTNKSISKEFLESFYMVPDNA